MCARRDDGTLYAGTVWRTRAAAAAAMYIIKSLWRLNGRRILAPRVPALSRARVYERTNAVRSRESDGKYLAYFSVVSASPGCGAYGVGGVCRKYGDDSARDGMTGALAYADIYWVERIKGLVRDDAGGVGHPILLRILITTPLSPVGLPHPPARPDDPTPALIVHAAAAAAAGSPGRPRGNKVKNRVSPRPLHRRVIILHTHYAGGAPSSTFPFAVRNAMHNIYIYYCYFVFVPRREISLHTKIPFRS